MTSSSANTTPVIGVLKMAAIPAAAPTGIMPRTTREGRPRNRATPAATPLVSTTVGPSGPRGTPAPSESGVAPKVPSSALMSRREGSRP
jgi:hypothetical protein